MTAKAHPSNLFYRGEIHDFLDACENDRAQTRYEFGRFPADNTEEDSRHVDAYLARIDTAERLYREIVLPALEEARARCCDALRQADLDHYARALEHDDYTGLAI